MRANHDKNRINRMLKLHGLGTLEEPGTVHALARLVADHDHFRQILLKCEPALRREMYDAMAPYLQFRPRPLDTYVSEAGAIAERMQYPTIDEAGDLHAFRPPEIGIVQEIVDQAFAKARLVLTCVKCTRVEEFTGERKADAVVAARLAGWTYDELRGDGREICPECPAVRN